MKKLIFSFSLITIVIAFIICLGFSSNNESFEIVEANDIILNKSHIYLNKGETKFLSAKIFPTNSVNQDVYWQCSDNNIAVVSNGLVTGLDEGTANIFASLNQNKEVITYCKCIVGSENSDAFNINENFTNSFSKPVFVSLQDEISTNKIEENNLLNDNNIIKIDDETNAQQNELTNFNSEEKILEIEKEQTIASTNSNDNKTTQTTLETNENESVDSNDIETESDETEDVENSQPTIYFSGYGFSFSYNSNGIDNNTTVVDDSVEKEQISTQESSSLPNVQKEMVYQDDNTKFEKFIFRF